MVRRVKKREKYPPCRIPNLQVGDIVEISKDPNKPNDHFQKHMMKYIGERVKITNINGRDGFGFRQVHCIPSYGWTGVGQWCWREYDFVYVEGSNEQLLEEDLFKL